MRRDRDGDRTRVTTKFVTRRDSYEHYLCISIIRHQYPVHSTVHFGISPTTPPLENPVSRYNLLLFCYQAGRTQNSSLTTVTTVATFPKWTLHNFRKVRTITPSSWFYLKYKTFQRLDPFSGSGPSPEIGTNSIVWAQLTMSRFNLWAETERSLRKDVCFK
jgi:hypothetical protein